MNSPKTPSIALPIISGICIGIAVGLLFDELSYRTAFLQVVLFGTIAALSSFFLEFCYQEGNIFGWWIAYLDNNVRDNKRSLLYPLYKPLGGCIYCQNIWIAFAYFFIGHYFLSVSWWLLLPIAVFSHFVLTMLDYTFWRT